MLCRGISFNPIHRSLLTPSTVSLREASTSFCLQLKEDAVSFHQTKMMQNIAHIVPFTVFNFSIWLKNLFRTTQVEIEEPLYHTNTKGLAATFGWSFRSKKRCVFLSRWQTSRLWVGFRMGPAQVKWGLKLVPVVLLVVPTGPHVKQECCWTTA